MFIFCFEFIFIIEKLVCVMLVIVMFDEMVEVLIIVIELLGVVEIRFGDIIIFFLLDDCIIVLDFSGVFVVGDFVVEVVVWEVDGKEFVLAVIFVIGINVLDVVFMVYMVDINVFVVSLVIFFFFSSFFCFFILDVRFRRNRFFFCVDFSVVNVVIVRVVDFVGLLYFEIFFISFVIVVIEGLFCDFLFFLFDFVFL